MELLTQLGGTAKRIGVFLIRLYVLILGLWGVVALVQGLWLFAAVGLAMPVLYFASLVWRGYRQADTKRKPHAPN